jgi:para-aminobenzoate synthetase/4-amino-4-deoxychorismate lyase
MNMLSSNRFDILETLALDGGAFRHLDAHLARMARSAAHFAYPWSPERVRASLQPLALAHGTGLWRVRLVLSADGAVRAEAHACATTPVPVRLQLADRPLLEAHSDAVRHKLTLRHHYDALAPTDPAVFDTLLWNEAGELTECTRGNIAACVDGQWLTPPVACGLLPGVGRAVALREGRLAEAVLRLEDVPRVEAWAFVNSLRGWLDAELDGSPRTQPANGGGHGHRPG